MMSYSQGLLQSSYCSVIPVDAPSPAQQGISLSSATPRSGLCPSSTMCVDYPGRGHPTPELFILISRRAPAVRVCPSIHLDKRASCPDIFKLMRFPAHLSLSWDPVFHPPATDTSFQRPTIGRSCSHVRSVLHSEFWSDPCWPGLGHHLAELQNRPPFPPALGRLD